jgi:hypothetical protein
MSHPVVWVAVLMLGVAGSTNVATAFTGGARSLLEAAKAAVSTTHPLLKARLDLIAQRSPLWRAAVLEVARTGRRALIVTPDEVVVGGPAGRGEAFPDGILAEVALVPRRDTRVDVVFVVINLPLIERIQRQTGALPAEMEADLDRILVHELYGHAVPYLLAGDLSGKCPDPQPGQPAREACAIQRENAVRAELGFNPRVDYGLADLALIRLSWQ